MKHNRIYDKHLASAICGLLLTLAALPASAAADYVAGQVLVRFAPTVTAQSQTGMLSQMARTTHSLGRSGLTLVHLNSQYTSVKEAVNSLQGMPGVLSVQPNYVYHALALPNDPSVKQQWALQNTGQVINNATYTTNNPGTSGDDISAAQAWNYVTDCSSATVAVLDTGINYTQKDLTANMWNGGTAYPNHGYDYYDGDNIPLPTGGAEQHGTHVAGIIGAVGNNSLNGSGICQKASLMAVRVLGPDGAGTTATLAQGINFAVDHGAKVINMSLGTTQQDPALETALQYAQSHGVIVVTAAGNNASNNDLTPEYPCSYPESNIVCVAAIDQSFQLATFSNYGANSVDVGAPGTNYLSTWGGPIYNTNSSSFGGWQLSSTTSGSGGGWATATATTGDPIIIDPASYPSGTYNNNTDDRAWGNFDLTAASHPNLFAASLNYQAQWNTESGKDFFNSAFDPTGIDPFNTTTGTQLQHSSGSNTASLEGPFNLNSCLGHSCAVGFQLTSDAQTTAQGVLVGRIAIQTNQTNSTVMQIENGTSMATPVVSGIAAMLYAYAPSDTDQQVIEAIKNGGRNVASLAGKTVTGKAVNAMGSLAYISLGITGLKNLTLATAGSTSETFAISGIGTLSLSARSSNQALVPDSAISGISSCTASGPCTIDLTTTTGQTGSSVITLTLANSYGQQKQYSFTVTVGQTSTTTTTTSGGGGGALNPWWLLLMLAALSLAALRRRSFGGMQP